MRVASALLLLTLAQVVATAQVCRLSVAGLNRNRRVSGPVNAECPFSLHSPPFGNWGVTSTFGSKADGRQFEGWCRDTRACDNNGNCATHCRDGWYEWNSCTDHPLYRAPNDTMYNAENGTQQVSVTGVNVHGTRIIDVPVSCPVDTDGDGVAESGGCASVDTYRSGTNFMSLYELDPGTTDDLIQTLYFPEAVIATGCKTWNCPAASSPWAGQIGYDSPVSPAKVQAEVSVLINSGMFIDTARICRLTTLRADLVSGASFRPGPVAPESIVSVFGQALATDTAAAAFRPLPTTLAGTSVSIVDSAGVSRAAPLFYVSPEQINLQVPPNTAAGTARATITRADGISSQAMVEIVRVAPGLFAANAGGTGVAAAIAVRVAADSSQQVVPVFQCGQTPGTCAATPLDLGGESDQLILVLFGTGIRFHSESGPFRVLLGGVAGEVLYAGAQGEYVGLDQINVRVPGTLRGRGLIDLVMVAGGRTSNAVQVAIQ